MEKKNSTCLKLLHLKPWIISYNLLLLYLQEPVKFRIANLVFSAPLLFLKQYLPCENSEYRDWFVLMPLNENPQDESTMIMKLYLTIGSAVAQW